MAFSISVTVAVTINVTINVTITIITYGFKSFTVYLYTSQPTDIR